MCDPPYLNNNQDTQKDKGKQIEAGCFRRFDIRVVMEPHNET